MNQQEKDATLHLVEEFQQTAVDVVQPVMEQAIVFAAEYAKACDRDTILAKDMEYAMKYCAMNEVGKKTGSGAEGWSGPDSRHPMRPSHES